MIKSTNRISGMTGRATFLISVSALACAMSCEGAQAQSYTLTPPPVHLRYDDNAVDLINGTFNATIASVVIGDPANGGIAFTRTLSNGSMYDNVIGFVSISGSTVSVTIGGSSENFKLSGSTYTPNQVSGSTLTSASAGYYTYTISNGTVIQFVPLSSISHNSYANLYLNDSGLVGASVSVMSSYTQPNKLVANYSFTSTLKSYVGPVGNIYLNVICLTGIASNAGYAMSFSYGSATSGWITGVTTTNSIAGGSGPALTIGAVGANPQTYTDSLGHVTKVMTSTSSITLQPPSSSTPTTTVSLDGNGHVSQVVKNGITTTYSFSNSGGGLEAVTVARAGNPARKLTVNIALGEIVGDIDPLTNITGYGYNSQNQLFVKDLPENNSVNYNYDVRGNIYQTVLGAKPASKLANITTTSGFDVSCANAVKCNQPNWTQDALGNETDYTYDPSSGLLTSVNPPAAPNGVRPQTRISYTMVNGVQLVTATSVCRTEAGAPISGTAGVGPFTISGTAACVGTSDETRTTIAYDSNLRPLSKTVAAGDNSLSVTTSQTYDNVGNVLTSVGALGAGQTTVNYYNADRQLLGTVTPDPDSSGPRTPAAVKYTYNADGVLTEAQIGTVPDQTANSFNNSFTEAYHSAMTLDAYDRPIRAAIVSGGTNYAVSDQLYDSSGRASCAIQYMNMAAVPGSVATTCAAHQTTGPYGSDRVVQSSFDADNRVLSTTDGVGVLGTVTYSPNGNQLTALDGQNNLTSYKYDGFDRLLQTNFPVAAQGGNVSDPNNYEQLTYDADGHVLQKQLRSGTFLISTFDNLGRLSSLDHTDNGSTVTYSYNLLNEETQRSRNFGGVESTSYDALGRIIAETQLFGTMSYQYDAAGDLAQLTWGDGFYVNYTYDYTGKVSQIQENGATSGVGLLAQYSYDGLGRRTNVTYGNGTSRGYTYDPVSRLASIQLSFPNGLSYNNTIGPITYTPASQIASIARSNDAYAWTGGYNVNRAYVTNGLNQFTISGGTTLGYDGNGNLSSSANATYSYDGLNRLGTVSGGITIGPGLTSNRINLYTVGSVSTYFYYAGAAITAETNGTSITQRYVPGPGTDEPIVWYNGGTTAGRLFLQADERGSIIATTNSAGAMVGVNSFDEFGIPASSNIGRYQYTGQTWFPEVGLYNYKARWYSPTLGRFMQTDPIGYGDGLNMNNYAHSDPINGIDPTGTDCDPDTGDGCAEAILSAPIPDPSSANSPYDLPPITMTQSDPNVSLSSTTYSYSDDLSSQTFSDDYSFQTLAISFQAVNYGISSPQSGLLRSVCGIANSFKDVADAGVNVGGVYTVGGALAGGAAGGLLGPEGAVGGAAIGAEPGAEFTELAGIGSSGGQLVVDLTNANSLGSGLQAIARFGVGVGGGRLVLGVGAGALRNSFLSHAERALANTFGGQLIDRGLSAVDGFLNPQNHC